MAKKIKKNHVFAIYMISVFILSGILVYLLYLEQDVDSDIIPLSYDGIAYVFAAIIIVGTLFFVGYMFSDMGVYFKGGKERERILKEGKSAKAKIVKLGEEGESIQTFNEQPFVTLTLEVYDGDRKPYQVKLKTLIPRLATPQYQEGKYLWVKIDSQDRQKVAIDPESFSVNQSDDANVAGLEHWSEKDRKIIKEKGIEGEAEILKVEDTGKTKGSEVIIEVYYKVRASNIEPYELNGKLAYPTKVAEHVKSKVGSTVPARIHPDDRNKVILRFGEVMISNN